MIDGAFGWGQSGRWAQKEDGVIDREVDRGGGRGSRATPGCCVGRSGYPTFPQEGLLTSPWD